MKAPKDKNKPIQTRTHPAAVELVSTPLRFTIIISLLISGAGVAWACLAKIPIYVNGVSYMLRLGNVDAVVANTKGRIYYQFSASQLVQRPLFKRLYRFKNNPGEINNDEALSITKELVATPVSGPRLDLNDIYPRLVPQGQTLAWIDSPINRNRLREKLDAYEQDNRVLTNKRRELKKITNKINAKISILNQQIASERDYLNRISELFKTGYASRENVLRQKSRVDEIQTNIISYLQEITENTQQQLEAETGQQQAMIRLRGELAEYVTSGFLFARAPLYVVHINSPQSSLVHAEDTVMHISSTKLSQLPDHIPGYLSQSDAQQIGKGMAVLVTPMGMDRAQFGGIVGEVQRVNSLPSNLQQIAERIGSLAIAQEVTSMINNPVRVDLILQRNPNDREPNHGGFRWSSPGSPPFPISQGSQLNLQITAQRVTPLSLLIPFMLKSSGVSPPAPSPRHTPTNQSASQATR